MKVLVLGGSGLLGSTLVPVMAAAGHQVTFHSVSNGGVQADLRSVQATHDLLSEQQSEVLINLVCQSDVNACESNISSAFDANVLTVENVCRWLKHKPSTHLIHLSTDHVYDSPGFNDENAVSIKNTYALSKYCAEKVVEQIGGTILRTNFFGGSQCPRRASFSDWIIDVLKREEACTFFNDVHFSPLLMLTLSEAIVRVVESPVAGTFNLGSHEGMSKSDFAYRIAEGLALPITASTAAPMKNIDMITRPRQMMMNSTKFEENFSYRLPNLTDDLERFFRTHRAENDPLCRFINENY